VEALEGMIENMAIRTRKMDRIQNRSSLHRKDSPRAQSSMPSSLRRIKIFASNKTVGHGDIEDAMLIRKLFFASKVGRVGGVKRTIR
jgi:hypothetical protein